MGGEPPPSDTIYAPNLPAGITEDQVRLIFGPMGDITEITVLPPSGALQQAALVRFKSVDEAMKVIELVESLGGNVGGGLTAPISVRFADPPPRLGRAADDWSRGGGSYGKVVGTWSQNDAKVSGGPYDGQNGGKGAGASPNDRLNIANLPGDTSKEEVEKVFSQYGMVREVSITEQSEERSTAVVRFQNVDEASEVKDALDGNLPKGLDRNKEPLSITFYEPPQKQPWVEEMTWTAEPQSQSWSGSAGNDVQTGSGSGSDVADSGVSGSGGGGSGTRGSGTGGSGTGGSWTGGSGKTWKGGNFSMSTIVKGFEMSGALPGGSGWNDDDGTQIPLFIRGLSKDCEDVDIYKLFCSFGAIAPRGVRALKHQDGVCKGYGFVNFLTTEAAEAAIAALNDTLMPDGVTKLQVAHKNEGRGGGKGGHKGWHQQSWRQQDQPQESMEGYQGAADDMASLQASQQQPVVMAPAAEGSPAALAAAAAMQAAAQMQAQYW